MVGAVRFELTTSCTRNKRATRLRYAPNQTRERKVPSQYHNCNDVFEEEQIRWWNLMEVHRVVYSQAAPNQHGGNAQDDKS